MTAHALSSSSPPTSAPTPSLPYEAEVAATEATLREQLAAAHCTEAATLAAAVGAYQRVAHALQRALAGPTAGPAALGIAPAALTAWVQERLTAEAARQVATAVAERQMADSWAHNWVDELRAAAQRRAHEVQREADRRQAQHQHEQRVAAAQAAGHVRSARLTEHRARQQANQ